MSILGISCIIVLGIILFIVVMTLLIIYISNYNSINRLSIKIDETFSGIDVALAKRYDLLSQMVAVVKGYMKHEKETLLEVIKIRKGMSLEEKEIVNKKMDESSKKINIVIERYPELKADKNVMILQKAILDCEEHLQAARRLYNSSVSQYNQKIVTFPGNVIAKKINATKREFFKVEEEKKDYKVDM